MAEILDIYWTLFRFYLRHQLALSNNVKWCLVFTTYRIQSEQVDQEYNDLNSILTILPAQDQA